MVLGQNVIELLKLFGKIASDGNEATASSDYRHLTVLTAGVWQS